MWRFSFPGLIVILLGLSWQTVAAHDVRMVVTAAFVSNKGLAVYEELAQYLSKHIDADVRVISGTSYEESNMLLEQGIIQVGFVCGLPYVQQHAQGKLQLVAIPVMAAHASQIPGTPGYAQVPGKYCRRCHNETF